MSLISKVGDTAVGVCPCHKTPLAVTGQIISGNSTVLVNGSPVARIGDTVIFSCGHTGTIVSGVSNVMSGGSPVANVGSTVVGCPHGTVVTGSSNVLT